MDITELQMKAYNKKDLKLFLSYYSPDYKAYMLETRKMITKDKNQLSTIMKKAFENTKASSRILESIVQGNLIINKEESVGHIEGKTITSVTIYEIIDRKISRMWFGGQSITENKK